MAYRIFYGDASAIARPDRHLDGRVRVERFSTEHEALNRARELIEADAGTAIAICDTTGNTLTGVRLELKLGYCVN